MLIEIERSKFFFHIFFYYRQAKWAIITKSFHVSSNWKDNKGIKSSIRPKKEIPVFQLTLILRTGTYSTPLVSLNFSFCYFWTSTVPSQIIVMYNRGRKKVLLTSPVFSRMLALTQVFLLLVQKTLKIVLVFITIVCYISFFFKTPVKKKTLTR